MFHAPTNRSINAAIAFQSVSTIVWPSAVKGNPASAMTAMQKMNLLLATSSSP
jgi:hypothetical protein